VVDVDLRREIKKTKVLCTVGPASTSPKTLAKMYEAGMNGVRINTAFGDQTQYEKIILNVRRIGEIPILLDLKGPEVRLRARKKLAVKRGDRIVLGTDADLSFSWDIYGGLKVGDRVLFEDGRVQAKVTKAGERQIQLQALNEGILEEGKGVNFPGKTLPSPSLSEKDLKLIEFARGLGVEFLSLSFVRTIEDINQLRKRMGKSEARVVAKIENAQGVKNFQSILGAADGIMIARGDMGIELPQESVPLLQKQMVASCNQEGKMVITATEMLESMRENTMPTRAEVSDVANAILDGTDVVMLSGETAVGKYPVEAVATMARIAEQIEPNILSRVIEEKFRNISSVISWSVNAIAKAMPLDKVVTITRTGYTARMIARFRLRQPVIAVTRSPMVRNQLELSYGVQPFQIECEGDRILAVSRALLSKGVARSEDVVLFTAAFRTFQKHASNTIEIHILRELSDFWETQKL
jgi:pyruvate kinase